MVRAGASCYEWSMQEDLVMNGSCRKILVGIVHAGRSCYE